VNTPIPTYAFDLQVPSSEYHHAWSLMGFQPVLLGESVAQKNDVIGVSPGGHSAQLVSTVATKKAARSDIERPTTILFVTNISDTSEDPPIPLEGCRQATFKVGFPRHLVDSLPEAGRSPS
jgi:hypothetical protein